MNKTTYDYIQHKLKSTLRSERPNSILTQKTFIGVKERGGGSRKKKENLQAGRKKEKTEDRTYEIRFYMDLVATLCLHGKITIFFLVTSCVKSYKYLLTD